MVELADTPLSKSGAFGRTGSTPVFGTSNVGSDLGAHEANLGGKPMFISGGVLLLLAIIVILVLVFSRRL